MLGGLGVIVATDLTVTSASSWPSVATVAPVLATLAVVVGGMGGISSNLGSRVLALGPVVTVGLLSYSWYLWHWPLLVLVRLRTLETNLVRDTLIAVGALGLAALTYRLVEQPVRLRRFRLVRTPRLTFAIGASLVVVMIGSGLSAMPDRRPPGRERPVPALRRGDLH